MKYLDETGLSYFWNKIKAKMPTALDFYPVGSIYMSVNNVNPSSLFGGTWVAWGSGKVPVGVDTSQGEFNSVEKTGGEKTHKLTANEMPSHNHDTKIAAYNTVSGGKYYYFTPAGTTGAEPDNTSSWSTSLYTSPFGGNESHNNLQPYITCYMWKRTA